MTDKRGILLVPLEGSMVFSDTLTVEDAVHSQRLVARELVKIDLNMDGDWMGSVVYQWRSPERNERATTLTGLLCGSYVAVTGEAVFNLPHHGVIAIPDLLSALREADPL